MPSWTLSMSFRSLVTLRSRSPRFAVAIRDVASFLAGSDFALPGWMRNAAGAEVKCGGVVLPSEQALHAPRFTDFIRALHSRRIKDAYTPPPCSGTGARGEAPRLIVP